MPIYRSTPLAVVTILLTVLAASVARAAAGDPLPGLSPTDAAAFTAGREAFSRTEDVADGLGPLFNDTSCAACHDGPAVGGTNQRLETRFGRATAAGFDAMASAGGSLMQDHAIGGPWPLPGGGAVTFLPEVVPPAANVVAHRRTTPLFGLGLVEAVPDAELRLLAALEAARTPATAGRAAVVTDLVTGARAVGRFG